MSIISRSSGSSCISCIHAFCCMYSYILVGFAYYLLDTFDSTFKHCVCFFGRFHGFSSLSLLLLAVLFEFLFYCSRLLELFACSGIFRNGRILYVWAKSIVSFQKLLSTLKLSEMILLARWPTYNTDFCCVIFRCLVDVFTQMLCVFCLDSSILITILQSQFQLSALEDI